MKLFFTIFITVFIAELGDKTQLATMLYASKEQTSSTLIFCAAALALVLSTFIGVFAGKYLGQWMNTQLLSKLAGIGFILVGVWTLIKS